MFISWITAVAAVVMKVPYNCPYCDQVSMRKWNLSTHMQRKHKGQWDPFKMGMENALTPSSYQTRNHYEYESFWPQFNPSDPFEALEKFVKLKNLTKELKQLSKMELHILLSQILNFNQNDSWSINNWNLR